MATNKTYRILVGLDLSPTDNFILDFLNQNVAAFGAKKMDFIHVRNSDSDTSDLIPEKLKDEIKKKIDSALSKTGIEHELFLKTGNPEELIKQKSSEDKIDLLILGHKHEKENQLNAQKLVKEPVSSILLVPQKKEYALRKICVATDFSEISIYAVKEAKRIAERNNSNLLALHTYQVPVGYHTSGKELQEYAKVMEENAKEEGKLFLEKAGIDELHLEYRFDKDNQPADCIAEFLSEKETDLLVLASKGRTDGASLLLGSIAKKVSQELYDQPIMIIKDKDDVMDLRDAIKEI